MIFKDISPLLRQFKGKVNTVAKSQRSAILLRPCYSKLKYELI